MKVSDKTFTRGDGWLRRTAALVLIAALAIGPIATAPTAAAPPAGARSEAPLTVFLMRWFTEMQAGRTERSLYAPAYVAQVTDAAVATMSRDLNKYGAAPLRAEIVQTRRDGDQTFFIVKFVFPRGDATSLLFGFDVAGKITGIAIGGLAGD
jgi:hypothetical protein